MVLHCVQIYIDMFDVSACVLTKSENDLEVWNLEYVSEVWKKKQLSSRDTISPN